MITQIRKFIKRLLASGVTNPERWWGDWLAGGQQTKSGVTVNPQTAMTLAAVWQATNVISGDVAQLPIKLYRREGNSNKEIDRLHPSYRLIRMAPNSRMSWPTLAQTLQAQALLLGNGYARISRNARGEPVAMWPLMADRTEPFIDRGRLWYKTETGSERDKKQAAPRVEVISPHNMFHIRGMGWDGLAGLSVITLARESWGLGIAGQRHGARYFGNYATPQGIISMPTSRPSPEVEKQMRSNWKQLQADDNEHNVAVLYNGATFAPISLNNQDSQWLESRAFQRNEVASWFNLPPHKVGDLERATFSNIFEQNLQYLTTSLMHWLVTWEKELSAKLLTQNQWERDTHFFEFVTDAFMRADPEKRTNSLMTQFLHGKLTINEWRAKDSENSIGEDGDVHFVPLNMTTLERAIQGSPEPAEPPPNSDDDVEPAEEEAGNANNCLRQSITCAVGHLLESEYRTTVRRANNKANLLHTSEDFYERWGAKLKNTVVACGGTAEIANAHIRTSQEWIVDALKNNSDIDMIFGDWRVRTEWIVDKIMERITNNAAS